MTSLNKALRISYIRRYAKMLVGECSDYQIMFCASAAGMIYSMGVRLEDLSDGDVDRLYFWMADQTI